MDRYKELIEMARTCSAQARGTTDKKASAALRQMAEEYLTLANDRAERLGLTIKAHRPEVQAR